MFDHTNRQQKIVDKSGHISVAYFYHRGVKFMDAIITIFEVDGENSTGCESEKKLDI